MPERFVAGISDRQYEVRIRPHCDPFHLCTQDRLYADTLPSRLGSLSIIARCENQREHQKRDQDGSRPNGQRISGERRAEGDERVRCMRVLGAAI